MVHCLHCNVCTDNPKFCSRSCAAAYNNKKHPKRRLELNTCKTCQIPVKSGHTYCTVCLPQSKDYTLEEVMYDKHHKSSSWALVRSRARAICKDLEKACKNCGYSKHTEICHIKPIKDFPLETKLSVVNSLENLLILCPNCHWEFDNGLLKII